ncbi:RHS repeat-associated core domain-containing protein [Kroppenstedtia eburnea]|uniref:RHS repeat-associated core domain-containing protein n=2 Tax=Kroppenstedtia eburnea TaxID=714067 RepID=UPI00135657CC|nr:RHS repeat-associated core domain-containing protein [Kroppenstedtia eburnea]QKI81212.1 RHS repeat-associated core domain-containing protein [Kroppenstedtia eburnea]
MKDSKGTTSYVYDKLEQLVEESQPDGTVTEYTYDATGNRLTKKVTQGDKSTTTNYTYDDADQLAKVNGQAYSYDKNGNLTHDGKRTYVYDAENRLTAVKEGEKTLASFTYRADGMRKTMTTGSQTLTFHYDENKNVTYETDQNHQIVAHYTYGANNELVSMTRGGKTYYYQTNYRGDVTALTDSTGAVVATYEYDAFGNLLKETGTVENPYRYAGYRYDEVTGLYYLQSRYYNPETGRFLTRDSFEGFEDKSLGLNKYSYVLNNPVINVDPDGHWFRTIRGNRAYMYFTKFEVKRFIKYLKWGRKGIKALGWLLNFWLPGAFVVARIVNLILGVGGTYLKWASKRKGIIVKFKRVKKGKSYFYPYAISRWR